MAVFVPELSLRDDECWFGTYVHHHRYVAEHCLCLLSSELMNEVDLFTNPEFVVVVVVPVVVLVVVVVGVLVVALVVEVMALLMVVGSRVRSSSGRGNRMKRS